MYLPCQNKEHCIVLYCKRNKIDGKQVQSFPGRMFSVKKFLLAYYMIEYIHNNSG